MTGLEKLCSAGHEPLGKTSQTKKQNNDRYVVYYRVTRGSKANRALAWRHRRLLRKRTSNSMVAESSANTKRLRAARTASARRLSKAIFHANRSWATLLIAKMDRLARNVFFISAR